MKTFTKSTGSASVEFVMGFMLFWLICMAWIEMSYMSYISAICDLVLSEAARESKLDNSNYRQAFTDAIADSGFLWGNVADPNKFKMSIQYVESVNELQSLEAPCSVPDEANFQECGMESMRAIAVYRIDYEFESVSTYFMDRDSIFSREAIVIQEYERDAFEF